ncbi:hypothetical protein [Acetobacter oryzoeni]|uniref:Uncharacterized protein n=1 Tax=Acetobacter oryzoeni TaxID=2500548 RepID=A0A5B9GLI2_9PROT|nr:hypothetical protein [Acetobacter oryzoeni]MCP1203664.1 hypothetical protein [Acetobacter oryzoeni]QEE86943.1 hypothetical protein EOV40_014700 [Acetobacter oryzoeni]
MDTKQITDRERRFLTAILPPRQTRKSQKDRLKALARAFQTTALSISGAGIITPLFTGQVHVSSQGMILAGCIALIVETISLLILAFIRYPEDGKENADHE